MTEDELVKALEDADLNELVRVGPDGRMARALLDAVRLIRKHELMGECNKDSDETYNTHGSECEVGMWVRAAERAGL